MEINANCGPAIVIDPDSENSVKECEVCRWLENKRQKLIAMVNRKMIAIHYSHDESPSTPLSVLAESHQVARQSSLFSIFRSL